MQFCVTEKIHELVCKNYCYLYHYVLTKASITPCNTWKRVLTIITTIIIDIILTTRGVLATSGSKLYNERRRKCVDLLFTAVLLLPYIICIFLRMAALHTYIQLQTYSCSQLFNYCHISSASTYFYVWPPRLGLVDSALMLWMSEL